MFIALALFVVIVFFVWTFRQSLYDRQLQKARETAERKRMARAMGE